MPDAANPPSQTRLTLALMLGIVAISFASVLIRGLALSGVALLTVAFYRMAFATAILGAMAAGRRTRITGEGHRRILLFSGVCLAAHFALWTMSFGYVPVARSVLIVSSQTVFVVIFSAIFLGERPTRRVLIGVVLAMAGVAIISAQGFAGGGGDSWKGDLLALGGAVTVVGYFLSGRYSRARLGLLGYVVPVYTIATLGLLLLCVGSGAALTGFPPRIWIGFLLLAIIPTIFGHTVFNWLLGYLRADTVSVAILAEPVGAAVLAFLIFGEVPSMWTIVGAPLILGGLVLASIRGRQAAD